MTTQKSWIDLLGRDTDWVHVDENRIVRGFPDSPFDDMVPVTVLWTCDTPEQAQTVFEAWLTEIIKEQDAKLPPLVNVPPIGTYAYTAMMMARYSPVEGDPDFWDRWKDEMKERDLS